MPTYTYKCICNAEQEIGHSIHDQPKILCAKCGQEMRKLPQVASINFVGKGWASKNG